MEIGKEVFDSRWIVGEVWDGGFLESIKGGVNVVFIYVVERLKKIVK